MCWIGIFVWGCEAANAGETLGPRAVVNAVSKASIFLGAAEALIRANITLLRPRRTNPCVGKCPSRRIQSLASPYFETVTRLLKVYEFEPQTFHQAREEEGIWIGADADVYS